MLQPLLLAYSNQIKCIYIALCTSADISKCCTETQPKTPNSKQCRCRSTFNLSFVLSEIPKDWKAAAITAIEERQSCSVLFIDLAKDFDSVNHHILIGRLNSLGFSNDCLAWFTNYFSDRIQCVKSEGLLSGPLAVYMGVPQGSIIGPIHFSVYINDVTLAAGDSLILL